MTANESRSEAPSILYRTKEAQENKAWVNQRIYLTFPAEHQARTNASRKNKAPQTGRLACHLVNRPMQVPMRLITPAARPIIRITSWQKEGF
jgi:hypothetical protein